MSPPPGPVAEPVATDPGISASRANERLRFLVSQGQTALPVPFDLPTQFGHDSGDPLVAAEVGRAGVAIDTACDMCELFAGIPLDQVSVNFLINATAPIILAAYLVAAERSGVPYCALTGTLRGDVLAEFLARRACLFPPGPSLRLVTDVVEFAVRELPRLCPISITGCPGRETGCDAAAELALAMASAIAYCEAFLARGLSFDAFAPRLSFRFAAARNLAGEAAKLRAARRIWHRVATERLGATSPAAARLRFFSSGPGGRPCAPWPAHHDTGPAGSCCVERLTDEIEARASALLAEIDALGGAAAAIDAGAPQRWMAGPAARTGAPPEDMTETDPLAGERQAARTRARMAARDPRAFIGALLRLADDTRAGRNVMPALIVAARAGTTVGEMAGVFRDAFGTFLGPAPW
ncbi:MAG TPA: methylmalonyl-CoA mutase family protein [Streptosporangiaceae bacterium]|nr:methylmalonyl-CoA mutase family protein [Streptosporangiaceae bacterium]